MNNNIFSPKGKIDQSTFIIYFIILMILYFIIGIFAFPLSAKFKINIFIPNTILFIINLLIFFNYKKRLMDAFDNKILAIILGLITAFDHIICSLVVMFQVHNSELLFFAGIVFVTCIQPAIVGLLPHKKTEE